MPPKEDMNREVKILSECLLSTRCAHSTRRGPGDTEMEPRSPVKAQARKELTLGISTQLIWELVLQVWKVPRCGSEVTQS